MDRQQRRNLKHDKFVDEIGTLSTRARENQRLLLAITGALVGIALVAYLVYFYRANREQHAQDALGKAIDTIESPLMPPPGGQPIPNARFKTEQERTAAAEKEFREVTAKYSGSDAADVATLYLARISAAKGDIAGARKNLEGFIDDHPKSMLVGGARYSLYQIRIDSGEAPKVTQELQAEIGKSDPVLPADSLLSLLARAYEVQGDAQKTKETYRRIATEYPDSPYAIDAQRRIGRA